MQRETFLSMRQNEEQAWWYVGRRAILRRVLTVFSPANPDRSILEIGCGTGGNLALLSELGRLSAIELNDDARELAARRNVCRVERGFLPDGIPFTDSFDLIGLFDVLEHVDDDQASLRAIREKLFPGGRLILTVPTCPFLWSRHDVVLRHKRRYEKKQLRDRLRSAGFSIVYETHFNTLLFLPIALMIGVFKLLDRDGSELKISPLNALFTAIFASERHWMPKPSLPFGISLLVVAERSG